MLFGFDTSFLILILQFEIRGLASFFVVHGAIVKLSFTVTLCDCALSGLALLALI